MWCFFNMFFFFWGGGWGGGTLVLNYGKATSDCSRYPVGHAQYQYGSGIDKLLVLILSTWILLEV